MPIYQGAKEAVVLLVVLCLTPTLNAQAQVGPQKLEASEVATLSFSEFFAGAAVRLEPSARLRALNHKRVRIAGYMAQMEEPLKGSFYLVPRPVFCDEEGGGIADIPPEAVLVIAPFLSDQKIDFVSDLIDVVGIIEIGNKEEGGRVSSIRLILDQPTRNPNQLSGSKKSSNH